MTTAQSSLPAAMGPGLQFDWYLWSIYETRVRVMYYIFILDSGFCIFHNYPPRLALAEIKVDLPCPEDVYEAVDSTDCFQKAYNHNSAEPSSLERILKLLLAEDFGEEEKCILSTLTPLHYFIIINAFHIIIRTAHAISYSKIINDNVDRALSRWKSGWEIHKKQITTRQSKRLGFVKHAKEYWWLAKL